MYVYVTGGDHGYDNTFMDMHPIFIAHGPAFRKGIVAKPFSSLDIYPLICHILDIEPAQHDGNLTNAAHILANGKGSPVSSHLHQLACMYK